MTLQIEIDPDWKVGDIIKVEGKNHRITKKTTTALAVERYYFFDRWLDKLGRRKMSDIKQAAKWMKDGKEVQRPHFFGGFAYRAARKLSGISNHIETNDNADMADEPFTLADLLADDWEIAE